MATVADLLACRDPDRLELIGGAIVDKAAPTMEHAATQFAIAQVLGPRFNRKPGGRWPGGWWLGASGYLLVHGASAGETARAEPFDAVEIRLGVLFGDEDEDDA